MTRVFALSCLLLWLVTAGTSLAAQVQQGRATLTLTEALELAEKRSETVGIERAELARAEGDRRRARSAYLPQLSGSVSYQRTLASQFSAFADNDTSSAPATTCDRFIPQPGLSIEQRLDSLESAVECASGADPFASFRDLPFGRENTYRFGLSFSQTLFTGGRVSGQARAADANVRRAELGLTSAQAQLLLDVTGAYFDAALGDRLLAIALATLEQADTTLSETRLARQVGNVSEFDLLRAQVTRDNQRPVVIQRQADRDLAYYRLKQLLDLPLGRPVVLTTELGDSALIDSARIESITATSADTAPAARAPVRQAAEALAAQSGLLRAARGQRLPQVALTSEYAQLAFPDKLSPFGTDFVSDWTVTLGMRLPLFSGGRIGGDIAVAQANQAQAELRLQQTRELAELDTRNSRTQLAAAEAAWQASAGTVEQAARAYSISELRYREGISTQTELLDSRVQLQQAQASRARAARDLQVARMRIALLPALPLAFPAATTAAGSAAAQAIPAPVQPQPQPYTPPPPSPPISGTAAASTGATGP
jgi:outer membrane protein TolC